jgi:hypothetical protein
MQGYFSFILVFVSVILLLALIQNLTSQPDYSKALAIERAYALSMNVKETIIASAVQGAEDGFLEYDNSHDTKMCIHCKGYCTYDRDFPNYCDDQLCSLCFKESEAREIASQFANLRLILLNYYEFDPDFSISISSPSVSSFLKPNSQSKNGFDLDRIQSNELSITLNSSFLSVNSTFPEMVIFCP